MVVDKKLKPHIYVYDVGGHKTFSFMNNQMVAMVQLLLLLSMFVQVSKEEHFKDALEDIVIQPICLVRSNLYAR